MPVVVVPPPYRGPTGGEAEVKVEDGSARACLEAVEQEHPGFLGQVFGQDGEPHRFVRLFRNGELLTKDELASPLAGDDRLEIVAAIAGG